MQTFAEIAALREQIKQFKRDGRTCLLYTSPSPRDP